MEEMFMDREKIDYEMVSRGRGAYTFGNVSVSFLKLDAKGFIYRFLAFVVDFKRRNGRIPELPDAIWSGFNFGCFFDDENVMALHLQEMFSIVPRKFFEDVARGDLDDEEIIL